MKLFDRHGRVRERALDAASLRGRGAGRAGDRADGDRLLIRFTYPNDIRGTGFLVWEHPNADDERFLYLPSLGRVRRIAGTETQESFVGSDFTYEDIGGREFDDYTYALAGPDHASWTAPAGGPPRAAWRLESRRKDASAEFPRVVSLVLKDSFVVVGAEIYNRRNEKQKIYTVRRLEQIEGIWTVMESEMTNALAKTRTELVVEETDYNVGLKDDDFSRRELERAASGEPASLAGVIYRWRLPLTAFIVLGALALAPRANITNIDNDITAWFSQDGSGLPGLRALPGGVRRHPHADRRAEGRPPRAAVLARTLDDSSTASPATSSASTRCSASTAWPPRRSSTRRCRRRSRRRDGGLDVRPLIEDLASRDPADVRRRALDDDLHPRRSGLRGRHRRPRSSSSSTRIASTPSAPASSSSIHDIVDPQLPAGIRAYYNGSLEISETYNRITLDNQRKFTPPILLFTILAIYVAFRSWRKTVLTLVAVLVSVLWTLGLYSLLGFSYNVLASMIVPLVVVLAIADDVHIMQHWDEERAGTATPSRRSRRRSRTWPRRSSAPAPRPRSACCRSRPATSSRCASFGIGSAIGVMVDFVISLVLMPTLLAW